MADDLLHQDLLVYMSNDPRAYYAIPQLARVLGLSYDGVQEHLRALVAAGYIERRSPTVPLYTLTPRGVRTAMGDRPAGDG